MWTAMVYFLSILRSPWRWNHWHGDSRDGHLSCQALCFWGDPPYFLNPSAAPLRSYHRAESIYAEQEKNGPAQILGLFLTFL